MRPAFVAFATAAVSVAATAATAIDSTGSIDGAPHRSIDDAPAPTDSTPSTPSALGFGLGIGLITSRTWIVDVTTAVYLAIVTLILLLVLYYRRYRATEPLGRAEIVAARLQALRAQVRSLVKAGRQYGSSAPQSALGYVASWISFRYGARKFDQSHASEVASGTVAGANVATDAVVNSPSSTTSGNASNSASAPSLASKLSTAASYATLSDNYDANTASTLLNVALAAQGQTVHEQDAFLRRSFGQGILSVRITDLTQTPTIFDPTGTMDQDSSTSPTPIPGARQLYSVVSLGSTVYRCNSMHLNSLPVSAPSPAPSLSPSVDNPDSPNQEASSAPSYHAQESNDRVEFEFTTRYVPGDDAFPVATTAPRGPAEAFLGYPSKSARVDLDSHPQIMHFPLESGHMPPHLANIFAPPNTPGAVSSAAVFSSVPSPAAKRWPLKIWVGRDRWRGGLACLGECNLPLDLVFDWLYPDLDQNLESGIAAAQQQLKGRSKSASDDESYFVSPKSETESSSASKSPLGKANPYISGNFTAKSVPVVYVCVPLTQPQTGPAPLLGPAPRDTNEACASMYDLPRLPGTAAEGARRLVTSAKVCGYVTLAVSFTPIAPYVTAFSTLPKSVLISLPAHAESALTLMNEQNSAVKQESDERTEISKEILKDMSLTNVRDSHAVSHGMLLDILRVMALKAYAYDERVRIRAKLITDAYREARRGNRDLFDLTAKELCAGAVSALDCGALPQKQGVGTSEFWNNFKSQHLTPSGRFVNPEYSQCDVDADITGGYQAAIRIKDLGELIRSFDLRRLYMKWASQIVSTVIASSKGTQTSVSNLESDIEKVAHSALADDLSVAPVAFLERIFARLTYGPASAAVRILTGGDKSCDSNQDVTRLREELWKELGVWEADTMVAEKLKETISVGGPSSTASEAPKVLAVDQAAGPADDPEEDATVTEAAEALLNEQSGLDRSTANDFTELGDPYETDANGAVSEEQQELTMEMTRFDDEELTRDVTDLSTNLANAGASSPTLTRRRAKVQPTSTTSTVVLDKPASQVASPQVSMDTDPKHDSRPSTSPASNVTKRVLYVTLSGAMRLLQRLETAASLALTSNPQPASSMESVETKSNAPNCAVDAKKDVASISLDSLSHLSPLRCPLCHIPFLVNPAFAHLLSSGGGHNATPAISQGAMPPSTPKSPRLKQRMQTLEPTPLDALANEPLPSPTKLSSGVAEAAMLFDAAVEESASNPVGHSAASVAAANLNSSGGTPPYHLAYSAAAHIFVCLRSLTSAASLVIPRPLPGFIAPSVARLPRATGLAIRLRADRDGGVTLSRYVASQVSLLLVQNRATGEVECERIPYYIKKAISVMYQNSIGGAATRVMSSSRTLLFERMTRQSGVKMDSPASVKSIPSFIKLHHLDMNQFIVPSGGYPNFNSFFYRSLKPGLRLVPPRLQRDPRAIVSPADCRLTVFPSLDIAQRIWVKGTGFTLEEVLGKEYCSWFNKLWGETSQLDPATSEAIRTKIDSYGQQPRGEKNAKVPIEASSAPSNSLPANKLLKGTQWALVIARLAPQDYHKTHIPIDCVVGPTSDIAGAYLSVNPLAVRSTHPVFTANHRTVTHLYGTCAPGSKLNSASGVSRGDMAYIMVAATMVGACIIDVVEGSIANKADTFGKFAFGGSTVLLLMPADTVIFDDDVLNNSMRGIETLVEVGQSIGYRVNLD